MVRYAPPTATVTSCGLRIGGASATAPPPGRVGETANLAGAAIFFCSNAASFVPGQIIGFDSRLAATQ